MRIENLKMKIVKLPFLALPCLFAFLCLFGLTACDHKELCYHHEHYKTLRLEFDWRDAPEASPAGMSVFFYPEDSSQPVVRFNFNNIVGGEIEVPVGRYKILTYNSDLSSSLIDNEDYSELHRAFTREADLLEPLGVRSRADVLARLRAEDTEEERIVLCPDEMWGCNAIDVEVTEHGVSYICIPVSEKDEWIGKPPVYSEQVITLYPHELTCIYTYEIRNVENVDQVYQCSASISGMSPELALFNEELHRDPVTLPVEGWVDSETRNIVGRFITFGHHEENEQPHKMMLYVVTKDGSAIYFGKGESRFDVTDQVHSAPNKRRVHLIIDGVNIPAGEIEEPAGGLGADVDDWIIVNKDIEL